MEKVINRLCGDIKKFAANAFIRILNRKYPQTAEKITVWDVATPLTYIHSFKESWMSVMGKSKRPENYSLKPESLKNIYFAGQQLMQPCGLASLP